MKTLQEITEKLVAFRDERDWHQFHNPKDLAISLSIEAAELLECFQWKTLDEFEVYMKGEGRIHFQEEIADVAAYLLLLCRETGIDLESAILDKMKKNGEKYPVELSRGSSAKYNELKGRTR